MSSIWPCSGDVPHLPGSCRWLSSRPHCGGHADHGRPREGADHPCDDPLERMEKHAGPAPRRHHRQHCKHGHQTQQNQAGLGKRHTHSDFPPTCGDQRLGCLRRIGMPPPAAHRPPRTRLAPDSWPRNLYRTRRVSQIVHVALPSGRPKNARPTDAVAQQVLLTLQVYNINDTGDLRDCPADVMLTRGAPQLPPELRCRFAWYRMSCRVSSATPYRVIW